MISRKRKTILGLIFLFITILISAVIFIYNLLTKSLPDTSGEINCNKINNSIKIQRSEFDIPYISAENDYDLMFAFGYVTAQDRLFQMELERRIGQGRLSEIFGEKTIEIDALSRTIGFEQIARKIENNLSQESRDVLQAYSDGINFFISNHMDKLPIEFDLLGYEPEKWEIFHSLIIIRLFAWEMNFSWWSDLVLNEITDKFGEKKAADVFPAYPANGITTGLTKIQNYSDITDKFIRTSKISQEIFGFSPLSGSNCWAVSGEKSQSGYPLLANDPHLLQSIPSTWYIISLNSRNYNVSGVTIPGIPGVIIGRNSDIAWGITNGMVDECDFYYETIDSLRRNKFLYNSNWENLVIRNEKIYIKKREPVIFNVFHTFNGPIITDFKNLKGYYNFEYQSMNINEDTILTGRQISMRWTGFECTDDLKGMIQISKAKDINEFSGGIKNIKIPGLNFICADKRNNIGYFLAAKIPVRKYQNAVNILNGSLKENEWQGFIPDNLMPQVINPPEKYLLSANNKIIGNFPYVISNLWETPSRAQRIDELLKSKDKFNLNDFKQMQMDVISPHARELTPLIIEVLNRYPASDPLFKQVLTYLKNWDYAVSNESIAALIFNVFLVKMTKNTLLDEMGTDLFNRYCFLSFLPTNVITKLMLEGKSDWFDNISTPNVLESRDEIINQSMRETISFLKEKIGSETKKWRWDELHKVEFKHPFGTQKPLDKIFNVGPIPAAGSNTTINCGYYDMNDPFNMVVGPSMRFLTDLLNYDESDIILSSGQSGQPFSTHYKDQIELMMNGKYIPLLNSIEKVNAMKYKTLILKPQ